MNKLAMGAAAAALAISGMATAQPVPTTPLVASVIEMPDLGQNPKIMYRDGGVSARVGAYSYWLFADSAEGYTDANGVVHDNSYQDNTMSSTKALNAASGITLTADYSDVNGNITRFMPWSDDEKAWMTAHTIPAGSSTCPGGDHCGAQLGIWPQTMVYDKASKQVIVGFQEIERFGGYSGYPSTGSGLAVGTIGSDNWPHFERKNQGGAAATPTLMWSPGELPFINGAFIDDGYYYAYAYGNVWVNYLARVPVKDLLTKSAWQYYSGNETWSSDFQKAVVVFQGSNGNDVVYDNYLKQWVTIYLGYGNNQVYVRVADAPEGPWSNPELLTTVPLRYGNSYGYIVHVHPEFSDAGRTLYFTYTISPSSGRQVLPVWAVKFNK